MLVGINHPWVTCGHDFGPRPPAWGGAGAVRDWKAVEAELRGYKELGIEVARFWVLAGGVNYPAGEDPRTRFDVQRDRFLVGGATLPTLPRAYLDDFEALLAACRRSGVKLLPSLMSFELFHPIDVQTGDVWSNGRAALVLGDSLADRGQLSRFLDATLSPLLELSSTYRDAIYAWEVINEPDWVVIGGPIHARVRGWSLRIMPKIVPAQSMECMLEDALERVRGEGFVSTVGFKQASPRWLSPAFKVRLSRLGREGTYLHQLHYYPSLYEPHRLRPHEELPIRPCIVGEMPTRQARPFGLMSMAWLDGGARRFVDELNPRRYLESRLRLLDELGYPAALLWGARSQDEMSQWTAQQQEQVRRFSE